MIDIRDAVPADIPAVARVHLLTQPEYFTSTLGHALLTDFYSSFLAEDRLFVVAVDTDSSAIVGFAMGNWNGSRAEKKWEAACRFRIVARLFLKCLALNPLALSRAGRRLRALFPGGKPSSPETGYAHLLSLGVLSGYRGRHIASDMIAAFEDRCRTSPPPPRLADWPPPKLCTIGAYKWNAAGCALYRRMGYEVFEETETKLKFRKEL